MFETNEDTNMIKRCAFCNKKIKGMPASSIDKSLLFCDIICAKLYYDNIERFTFNRREYNSFYVNDQLSNTANEIFAHVGGIMFELLPYVYIEANDEGSDGDDDECMRNDSTINSRRQHPALDSALEHINDSHHQHSALDSLHQHPALESRRQHCTHPSALISAHNAHTRSINSRARSLSISSRRSAKTKYIKGLTPLLFNT